MKDSCEIIPDEELLQDRVEMVLDQFVQVEYPNLHEQVSLVHFYRIELLLLHYEEREIQQHNNVVVYE